MVRQNASYVSTIYEQQHSSHPSSAQPQESFVAQPPARRLGAPSAGSKERAFPPNGTCGVCLSIAIPAAAAAHSLWASSLIYGTVTKCPVVREFVTESVTLAREVGPCLSSSVTACRGGRRRRRRSALHRAQPSSICVEEASYFRLNPLTELAHSRPIASRSTGLRARAEGRRSLAELGRRLQTCGGQLLVALQQRLEARVVAELIEDRIDRRLQRVRPSQRLRLCISAITRLKRDMAATCGLRYVGLRAPGCANKMRYR
jgi:hypothetical protein